MTLQIDDLVETFEFLDDWEDRYRYIIDLGRKLPEMADDDKAEHNKVNGCTSQVWMVVRALPGDPPRFEFVADSDAHIVKGLIAILLAAYSGKTCDEILATDIKATFEQLGLEGHLSPNRRNGFFAMVERIKTLAKLGMAQEAAALTVH